MEHHQNSPNETQEPDQQDNVRGFLSRRELTAIAIAVWFFVGAFFLLRLYIYDHISDSAKVSEVLVASMFSLAIVIVVIIQAGIYFRQAKALDAQLEVTGQSLVIGYKSYVGVHSVSFDARRTVISIGIENVGHVPATDIFVSVNMIMSVDMNAANIIHDSGGTHEYRVVHKKYGSTRLFKGNLQIRECIHLADHLSDDQNASIWNQSGSLFLQGFITYQDGFKGQPQQRTDFFFRYSVVDNLWASDSPELWAILLDMMKEIEKQESKPN